MRISVLLGKVFLVIAICGMSTQLNPIHANPTKQNTSENKQQSSSSNSRTTRLLYELTKTEHERSNSGLINVSGKWYPKNSVGDFYRTEGLKNKIEKRKQKHLYPFWNGPVESLPIPSLMRKSKPSKLSIKSKKMRMQEKRDNKF